MDNTASQPHGSSSSSSSRAVGVSNSHEHTTTSTGRSLSQPPVFPQPSASKSDAMKSRLLNRVVFSNSKVAVGAFIPTPPSSSSSRVPSASRHNITLASHEKEEHIMEGERISDSKHNRKSDSSSSSSSPDKCTTLAKDRSPSASPHSGGDTAPPMSEEEVDEEEAEDVHIDAFSVDFSSVDSRHHDSRNPRLRRSLLGKSNIFTATANIDENILKTDEEFSGGSGSSSSTKGAEKSVEARAREIVLQLFPHVFMHDKLKAGGLMQVAIGIAKGSTEFCYLRPHGDNPYKFDICGVPDNLASEPYATLSKHGITRYHGGEAELCTLPRFLNEFQNYHILIKKKVIYNFRIWKAMYVWKNELKRNKSAVVARELSKHAMVLDGSLGAMLARAHSFCKDVGSIAFIDPSNKCYHIDDFVEHQRNTQLSNLEARRKVMNKLIRYLQDSGRDYTLKALERMPVVVTLKTLSKKRGRIMRLDENGSLVVESSAAVDQLTTESDSTGGVKQVQEKEEEAPFSYTEKSSIRGNCRRLASMLRVCDFFLRDAFYDSIEISLSSLLDHMLGVRKDVLLFASEQMAAMGRQDDETAGSEKNSTSTYRYRQVPLFRAKVVLVADQGQLNSYSYSISPSPETIMDAFRNLLIESLNKGSYSKSLLTNEILQELLVPIGSEVQHISLEDRIFMERYNSVTKLSSACNELLAEEFREVGEFMDTFLELSRNFTANTKFAQSATYMKLSSTNSEGLTRELSRLDTESEELKALNEIEEVGLVRLDFTDVIEEFKRSILKCKHVYHEHIPKLYTAKGEAFYQEAFQCINLFSKQPANLDEFIRMLSAYLTAMNNSYHFEKMYNEILALRGVIEDFELVVDSDVLEQSKTVSNANFQHNNLVSSFGEQVDILTKTYTKDLSERVKVCHQPLREAEAFLKTESLLSPLSDYAETLSTIKSHLYKLNVVKEKNRELNHYQELMKLNVFSVGQTTTVYDTLTIVQTLWKEIQSLRALREELMSSLFIDCDCNSFIEQAKKCSKVLAKTHTDRLHERLWKWLHSSISEFNTLIPCVRMLQADHLQDRHIERIEKVIGYKLYDERDTMLVEGLVSIGVTKHSEGIALAHMTSLYEHNIECKLNELAKQCTRLEYELRSNKDNKSVFYICNFPHVEEMMEDGLVTIAACLASTHSLPHKQGLIELRSLLLVCCEASSMLRRTQEGYFTLKNMFTSARTARQLSHHLKHFKRVDDVWRAMQTYIKGTNAVASLLTADGLREILEEGSAAINETNEAISLFIADLYQKWPKLLLIDEDAILDAIGMQDPGKTFQKFRPLLPGVSDLIFDKNDIYNTVGVRSGLECSRLSKTSSSRSSVMDWLRQVDLSLTDKLLQDVRSYVEEGKNMQVEMIDGDPQSTEQARLLVMQINFSEALLRNVKSGSRSSSLRTQLQELKDQTLAFSNISRNSASSKYKRASLANMIILVVYQRDLLSYLLSIGEDVIKAAVSIHLKKKWSSIHSTVKINHGQLALQYGFKYKGFSQRLVVTPLTDRCLLSLNIALQRGDSPVLSGSSGSNKLGTISALSVELGNELLQFDSLFIRSTSHMFTILKAVVESGLWVAFYHSEALSKELFSVLLSSVAHLKACVQDGKQKTSIGSMQIIIPLKPKFATALIYHTDKSSFPYLPASARRTFRPINMSPPDRKVIISTLVAAYVGTVGFDLVKLCDRLDAVATYLVYQKNLKKTFVFTLITHCVKMFDEVASQKSDKNDALVTVVQILFKSLPHTFHKYMSTQDLQCLCDLFLDTVYNPEIHSESFNSNASIGNLETTLETFITTKLRSHAASVVVVGAPGVGKSTVISQAIDRAILIYNDAIERKLAERRSKRPPAAVDGEAATDLFSQVPPYFTQLLDRKMSKFPNTFNPYAFGKSKNALSKGGSASSEANILMTSAMSPGRQAMDDFISLIDVGGGIEIVHVDVSADTLPDLMPFATARAEELLKPIKFIWECTDLGNMDPSMLYGASILCVSQRPFDIEALIEHKISQISKGSDHLSLSLHNCAELYLVPSAENVAPDSLIDKYSLIENCLRLFESIFGSLFHEDDYSIIFDDSLQKIFVFACIWNFGTCSPTSRSYFERWFLSHCNRMKNFQQGSLVKSRTLNRKDVAVITINTDHAQIPFASRQDVLGPLLSDIGSIFDFFLHKEDSLDYDLSMQWVTTKAELISSLNLRFERSYHSSMDCMDHVYSSIAEQPLSCHNVLVPTPTGDALHFIQTCMANSSCGGRLMLTGAAGSGVTSLIRQLSHFSSRHFTACTFESFLPPSAYSEMTAGHKSANMKPPASITSLAWEQKARWTCRTGDCSSQEMRAHVEASKKLASSIIVERSLDSLGCIVIDDMNISDHKEHVTTSGREWLRQVLESKNDYDIAKKRLVYYDQLYVLLSTRASSADRDTRLLRHFVTSYCHDEDISDIFATKVFAAFPSLTYDLCEDTAKLTKSVIENLRASKVKMTVLGKANNPDSIFYEMLRVCPLSNSLDNLLFKVVSALKSLDLFVTNDFIRTWNRVLTDYVHNFPTAQAELSDATTRALDGAIYKYAAFCEQIYSKPIAAVNGSSNKEEDLIIGLCKNVPDAFVAIKSPSFIKEDFFQRIQPRLLEDDPHTLHFLQSTLDLQQRSAWRDVQKIAGNITGSNGQGFCPHTLLTSATIDITKSCVVLACHVSDASWKYYLLSESESWIMVANDLASLLHSMIIAPGSEGGGVAAESKAIANVRAMKRVVCHVCVCDESPLLPKDWTTFQSLAYYSHPLMLAKLDAAVGMANASSANKTVRNCISAFISKISFVFSFSSLPVETTSIACLSAVSQISAMLSIVSISSETNAIYSHSIFSDKRLHTVIDAISDFVARDLIKFNENIIATTIRSPRYRCGTFKSVQQLLDLQSELNEGSDGWSAAMKDSLVNYSLFARQREVMVMVRRSSIYQSGKGRGASPVPHDSIQPVRSDQSKNAEMLAHALYSALYTRYLMLVSDKTQLDGIDFLSGLIKLNLNTGCMVSSIVPLAMAGAYLLLRQPFHSLQTVVSFAKNLPETAELRRVLSAVAVAFILHDFLERKDHDLQSDIAPIYVIDRTKTFSVLLKKVVHYHHFEISMKEYEGSSEFLMTPLELDVDGEEDKPYGDDVDNDPLAASLHDPETPLMLVPQGSTTVADLLLMFLLSNGFRVTDSDFCHTWARTNKETDLLCGDDGHLSYQPVDKLNKDKFVDFKYACIDVEVTWSLIVKVVDQMMHMLNVVLQAIDLVLGPKGLKDDAKTTAKTFSEYFLQDFLNEMCKLSRHEESHTPASEKHSESSGIGSRGGLGSINHDVTITKFKDNLGIILLQMITSLKNYLTEFEYMSMLLVVALQLHFETVHEAATYTTRLINLLKDGTGPVGYMHLDQGKSTALSARSAKSLRTLLDMTSFMTPLVYTKIKLSSDRTESAEIFHSISTDVERWSAWASDPNSTRFPVISSQDRRIYLSWADKIIVSYHLKPSILPHILLDAVADIGFRFKRGAAHDVLMGRGNIGATALSKIRYTIDNPSIITMPIFRNVNQAQDITVKFSARMGEANHFLCAGGDVGIAKALLELFSQKGSQGSEGLPRRDTLRRTASRRRSFVVALKDDEEEDEKTERDVSLITPFDKCDSHYAVQLHALSHSRNENFVLETDCSVIADAGSVVIFGDSGSNHAFGATFLIEVIEQKCLLVNSIPPVHITSELGLSLFTKCKYLLAVAHSIILCRAHILGFEGSLIGDDSLWDAVHMIEDNVLSQLGGWSCLNFEAALSSGNSAPTALANLQAFSSLAVVEVLINCVYCPATEGFLDLRLISSILKVIFKAENFLLGDPLLFGVVRLPVDQEASSLDTFICDLGKTFFSGDENESFSRLDILGSTNSELQSSCFNKVTHCFDNILTMKEHIYATHKTQPDGSRNESARGSLVYQHLNNPMSLTADLLPRFQSAINKLEAMLPPLINLMHERILASAAKNKLVSSNRKGSTTSSSSNAKDRRASAAVARKAKRSSAASIDRSKIPKDRREHDPLWTVIYLEALSFNRSLASLQSQLKAFLALDASAVISMGGARFLKILEILYHLESGYVPNNWSWETSEHHKNFDENILTSEKWVRSMHDRRSFLGEWLELGTPISVKLHLMSAPLLVVHAMRESFIVANNIADGAAVYVAAEVHNKGTVRKLIGEHDDNGNIVVSVPLSGIQLNNALLKAEGVSLMQKSYTNTAYDDVALTLSVSSVDKRPRRDQYLCNLLFRQEFPPPFLDLLSDQTAHTEEAVLTVPVNIAQGGRAVHCDLSNVYLCSSSALSET